MLLSASKRWLPVAIMCVLLVVMSASLTIFSKTAFAQTLQPSTNTSSFVVNANQGLPGLDTGIDLTSGSTLTITAVGEAAFGTGSTQNCNTTQVTLPDGQRMTTNGTLCPPRIDPSAVLPSAPVGELIASIAQPGTSPTVWFAIGSSYSATISATGRLFLLYNDSSGKYRNSNGSYQVMATVTTAIAPVPANTVCTCSPFSFSPIVLGGGNDVFIESQNNLQGFSQVGRIGREEGPGKLMRGKAEGKRVGGRGRKKR